VSASAEASRVDAKELERRLQRVLDERYHDKHPFNVRMHAGALTPDELRRWVRNRYYYQTRIPIKDGVILAKSEDREFRRGWIRRITDHDGDAQREGGLELWLKLADAVGLDRREVASLRNVLPGVRRACDAYVELVATSDLLASVAASLTESRAGALLGQRAAAFEKHYGWIAPEGLAYFRARTTQAPRDAAEGMAFVLAHARTPADAERCVAALTKKCEILWALLDAVEWGGTKPRLAAAAQLREGEPLVVLPERAVKLTGSGREILAACSGTRSVEEIAAFLRAPHPDAENVERDCYEFLEQMEKLGVIEGPA
jgi:pyrroloquinoline-quinone synthase